jgi:hypothetical protein
MLILTAFGSYLKLIESVSIGSLVGWVLWGWVPVWWCLCVVDIVVVSPNVCKKCPLTNKSTLMYKKKLQEQTVHDHSISISNKRCIFC